MELSSSDKERIQHRYDALAKKTLVGEVATAAPLRNAQPAK